VIYLVDKPGRFSAARIFAIAALGVLAVAFRIPAVALFPAFALFTALQYRQHGLRAAGPLLIWIVAGLLLLFVLPLEKLSAVRLDRLAHWSITDGITN
jgi:hypothetical protein